MNYNYLVKISSRSKENESSIGTGFIVSGGYLITCTHNITNDLQSALFQIWNPAKNEFSIDLNVNNFSQVIFSKKLDLAIYFLNSIEQKKVSGNFLEFVIKSPPFVADLFGFPEGFNSGNIIKAININTLGTANEGVEMLGTTQGQSITPGYSGGPFLVDGKVAAMVVEQNPDAGHARAISSKEIIEAAKFTIQSNPLFQNELNSIKCFVLHNENKKLIYNLNRVLRAESDRPDRDTIELVGVCSECISHLELDQKIELAWDESDILIVWMEDIDEANKSFFEFMESVIPMVNQKISESPTKKVVLVNGNIENDALLKEAENIFQTASNRYHFPRQNRYIKNKSLKAEEETHKISLFLNSLFDIKDEIAMIMRSFEHFDFKDQRDMIKEVKNSFIGKLKIFALNGTENCCLEFLTKVIKDKNHKYRLIDLQDKKLNDDTFLEILNENARFRKDNQSGWVAEFCKSNENETLIFNNLSTSEISDEHLKNNLKVLLKFLTDLEKGLEINELENCPFEISIILLNYDKSRTHLINEVLNISWKGYTKFVSFSDVVCLEEHKLLDDDVRRKAKKKWSDTKDSLLNRFDDIKYPKLFEEPFESLYIGDLIFETCDRLNMKDLYYQKIKKL